MMKFRIITNLLIFIVLINVPISGGELTGVNFLKIDFGNRAIAMGGAYCAVPADIISVFYNPSGLAGTDGKQLYLMARLWLVKTVYGSMIYSQNMKKFGVIGGGVVFFIGPKVERVDDLGFKTGELLKSGNFELFLTYAKGFKERFNTGISLKMIHQNMVGKSYNFFLMDIGIQYRIFETPSDRLMVGFSVKNWNFKFVNIGYVPVELRLGVEYKAYKNLKINFDITHTGSIKKDSFKLRYNTGIEYTFFNILSIRLGYKPAYDLETFTAGMGARMRFREGRILSVIDYSFTGFRDIAAGSHNFSFSIRF